MASDRPRPRLLAAASGVVLVLALLIVAWVWSSKAVPVNSPRARMYRTEADLASLVKAVEVYAEGHGAYPPAGEAGLTLAIEHLSRTVDYFPDGLPADGWGRAFHYVPHTEYARPGSEALRQGQDFCAPGAFQIYSVGADGLPGIDAPSEQRDNVCSWDDSKAWRICYTHDK